MDYLTRAITLATNGAEGGLGGYGMILIWVGIFAVFYFILIRPQQKQQKAHRQLMSDLKTGDRIITIGGFKGVISKVKDNSFKIKFAPDVELELIKSAVGRKDPDAEAENKN